MALLLHCSSQATTVDTLVITRTQQRHQLKLQLTIDWAEEQHAQQCRHSRHLSLMSMSEVNRREHNVLKMNECEVAVCDK